MPSAVVSEDGKSSKHLSSFIRLSPKVRLYVPPQPSTTSGSPADPTTILLCSWLNAAPKHIEYYCKYYKRLYPAARIILVTINTKEFLFHSEARRRADVKEAVSALLARDGGDERLFVHALSNGGGKRVYAIAGAYHALTGRPLPAKAFLLDSAPGIPKFRRDIHALRVPVDKLNIFLWLPYMSIILAVVSAVYVVVNWMPKWVWRDLVWSPTEGMNDEKLFAKNCVKGYVYSKEDLAIDWKDVETHAEDAEKKGYEVVRKRVERAAHVQLFRGKGGEKDYWGFVGRVWALGSGF